MSSRKIPSFLFSIRFRLIFWYSIIFIIACSILLFAIYYRIDKYNTSQAEDFMEENLKELTLIYKKSGLEGCFKHMELESKTSMKGREFFRVFKDYKPVKQFAEAPWDKAPVNMELLKTTSENKPLFEYTSSPGHRRRAYTMYAVLKDDLKIQMGISMKKPDKFLRKIRIVFTDIMFLGVIPASLFIGWFMSLRALRELRQLNDTVSEINVGKLDTRLPVSQKENEVTRLACTFNDLMDRLQKLMKEQKEVTDNIAHDLRSPLTRMRGEIELALSSPHTTDEYRATCESMIEEIDTLLAMINTLLDISSMELSVMEHREQISLNSFLTDIIEFFNYGAEEKNIHIELECDEKIKINASPLDLKRAMGNLLDNAIKYTGNNGQITVSAKKQGRQLSISIEDNGIGIEEKNLPKIFKRFYRCEFSRSESGNGLGLSLAEAIVKAHGGIITVLSFPGKGSKFTILLPAIV